MVQYTVLIPLRDGPTGLARQLSELDELFGTLARPYEIICIDDGSRQAGVDLLEELLRAHARIRVLRFDRPRGLSAALSAGMAAARGEIVIATAPGSQYPVGQIQTLIARLSRGDLVYGRRKRRGLAQAWRRIARIPRWLLLGLEVRDPDCLFWAARREAIAELSLTRGMSRYLPTLVASRGFRVSEVAVDDEPAGGAAPYERPNPIDLLAAWWLKIRERGCAIRELGVGQTGGPHWRVASLAGGPAAAAPFERPATAVPPNQPRA
jgi:glycosyltransferase involved in cell wall biosynthesis